MSEQVVSKKEKENKKVAIIAVIALAIIIALVVVIIVLLNREDTPLEDLGDKAQAMGVHYEPGVIGLNQDDLQAAFDKAVEKVKDGYVTLAFENKAESDNGKDFTCYLGNSEENTYDLFFSIYMDSTFSQQILLTGLVPPGKGINKFTSDIDLDPGTYEAVLVLSQVEDDHITLHSQTNVQLTLIVKG